MAVTIKNFMLASIERKSKIRRPGPPFDVGSAIEAHFNRLTQA
jgi:hypothetical protein